MSDGSTVGRESTWRAVGEGRALSIRGGKRKGREVRLVDAIQQLHPPIINNESTTHMASKAKTERTLLDLLKLPGNGQSKEPGQNKSITQLNSR